ncbi:MAG: hypothetical protein ACOX7I_02635 [Oscillospiraceae bacterium]
MAAAIIAALGTQGGVIESIFVNFAGGVGQMVITMFPVFTAAGLLSYVMDKTGASEAIGQKLLSVLGKDRAPLILSLTTVLLLAGVGTYIYIMVVLSNSLMKAANLPRRVGMLSCAGIAPCISLFPGPQHPQLAPHIIFGNVRIFSSGAQHCYRHRGNYPLYPVYAECC